MARLKIVFDDELLSPSQLARGEARALWQPSEEASICTLAQELAGAFSLAAPASELLLSVDEYILRSSQKCSVLREGDVVRVRRAGGGAGGAEAAEDGEPPKAAAAEAAPAEEQSRKRSRSARRKSAKRAFKRSQQQGGGVADKPAPAAAQQSSSSDSSSSESEEERPAPAARRAAQPLPPPPPLPPAPPLPPLLSWAQGSSTQAGAPIRGPLHCGDVLCHRVLEMSAEGPRLGPFRHALVTALGEEGVTLVPWPEEAAAQGLYVSMVESAEEALVPEGLEGSEAEAAFESARAALPGAPYATDYSVTLSLEELQDARRMGQEATGVEAAEGPAPALPVPPVPPPAVAQAEAQFKAAAAALAEARKAVAASGKSGGGRGRGGGLGGVLAHLRREEGALD